MRCFLPLLAALLPACTLSPRTESEREASETLAASAHLRPSPRPSPVQDRRNRPRHYFDVMLGAGFWDDLGGLDPSGIGPVPGRFDDFDRWGFVFDFGYEQAVQRMHRSDWTVGMEMGFASWQNDGTGLTTSISDISANMLYLAPTTGVKMHLSPRVTLSPGIGAGYYALRIEESEHYHYGWWHEHDSRTLNRDGTFGGFASLALDFHASPHTSFRIENKLHFVHFDGLEALYPNENDVDGPIWTIQLGVVLRF